MGDIANLVAFLGYLAVVPALGAVLGHMIARRRFVRRLHEATERASFLRVLVDDFAQRNAERPAPAASRSSRPRFERARPTPPDPRSQFLAGRRP